MSFVLVRTTVIGQFMMLKKAVQNDLFQSMKNTHFKLDFWGTTTKTTVSVNLFIYQKLTQSNQCHRFWKCEILFIE